VLRVPDADADHRLHAGHQGLHAAVFGGIARSPGRFLGGVLLGVIEIFAKAYISTQLSDAIVFAVLIIVLLVKPTCGCWASRSARKSEVGARKRKQLFAPAFATTSSPAAR
jgi:branched-subunit amino acid ABC-type transport system permease component